MKRTIIAALTLLTVCISGGFAGELKVTKIEMNGKLHNITLNNAITVLNIAFSNNKESVAAEFPVYYAKGKVYKQFSVLSRDFNLYLSSAVSQNKTTDFSGKTEFKVNKFSKAKNQKSIRAFSSVIFEDKLEVECRVMETNGRLWVAWPSNKEDGKWNPDFIFEDKLLKNRVEESMINKYKNNE
jgi:SpoVG.